MHWFGDARRIGDLRTLVRAKDVARFFVELGYGVRAIPPYAVWYRWRQTRATSAREVRFYHSSAHALYGLSEAWSHWLCELIDPFGRALYDGLYGLTRPPRVSFIVEVCQ